MKKKRRKVKPEEEEIHYYPVFINLKGKKVVVVGGGSVAERKILRLTETGADIKVISPCITRRLEKEKIKRRIKHIPRNYKKGDLKGAFLVIAATSSHSVNKQISKEATSLVNVVDMPDLCNFIVPSVVKRGPLTIAISTSGVSPAFSRTIRKELELLYSPEITKYLKFLNGIRKEVLKNIKDKKKRTNLLKSIASDRIIKMIREKGIKKTKRIIKEILLQ